MTDPLWLVRAMDAIQRILAAGVKVHRARTHRIVRTAFDIIGKRAEPPLLSLGRRPSRPFFLAADRGHAGPGLTILSYNRAIADRPASGQHVVNVASIGIDQDRAWRLLPVILNDLTLIGGRNPRLLIGWVRQLLLIAHGEIGVPHWMWRCLHASTEYQSSQQCHGCPSGSTRTASAEVGGAAGHQVPSVHFLTQDTSPNDRCCDRLATTTPDGMRREQDRLRAAMFAAVSLWSRRAVGICQPDTCQPDTCQPGTCRLAPPTPVAAPCAASRRRQQRSARSTIQQCSTRR